MFAIICHMAAVLWVQAEMCDGSVHFNSTLLHLCSPSAHFHYPQGIQGVMASRASGPPGHFKFSAQTFAVIVQELCGTVWIDETEPGEDVQQPPPPLPQAAAAAPPRSSSALHLL